MLPYYLLGIAGLVGMVLLNLAAMAGARYAAGRAAGVPGVRFPFHDGRPEEWAAAPGWARPTVVIVGPVANYLCAALLFFLALRIGGEVYLDATVNVIEGRPAAEAGMLGGDRVRSVDGAPIELWEDLVRAVKQHAGKAVEVVVEREGQLVPLQVTPSAEGKIGVTATSPRVRPIGTITALASGLAKPLQTMRAIASGALGFLLGSQEGELAGPARIVEETANAQQQSGVGTTLHFLGALNAYFWPGFVVVALATTPRRKKPG